MTLPHDIHLIRQYEEGQPEDGWRTVSPTGNVCMVCNCGTVTCWIAQEKLGAIAAEHRGEVIDVGSYRDPDAKLVVDLPEAVVTDRLTGERVTGPMADAIRRRFREGLVSPASAPATVQIDFSGVDTRVRDFLRRWVRCAE